MTVQCKQNKRESLTIVITIVRKNIKEPVAANNYIVPDFQDWSQAHGTQQNTSTHSVPEQLR